MTLFDELGAAGASSARQLFAAAILVAVWRPSLRGRGPGELRLALLFGLLLGGMNQLIYLAIDRIPLGVAVTVEFAGPLAVAVAGSRRALDGLWVLLAAAGILLLSGGLTGGDAVGIALALGAAACWAGYIVLGARMGRAFRGGSGLALAMCVGALVTLPAGLASDLEQGFAEPRLLLIAAGVALASSVIPYSLEIDALRRMPVRVFGVLMSLEPAVAALAGLVVLGQALEAREWAAVALVVAASAGATATARGGPPVRD